MGQYEVRHQCDPKLCKNCRYFYWDTDFGVYRCKKDHDEAVGRYAQACDDYKERIRDI